MDGQGGGAQVAPSGSRALHRYALATAGSTFVLLVAGANVTSTGSGLAVPDWPLAFGQLFPEMVGKVINEHGHRLIAMAVGMLTTGLTGWILWTETRVWVRWMGIGAFGAVILQGLLGAFTVWYKLPPLVSIGHGALAEAFFCLTIAIAVVLRPGFTPGARVQPLFGWCAASTLTVYAQILLGAYRRHSGSGLIWHLLGATATMLVVYTAGYRIFQDATDSAGVRRPAWWAMGLVGAQFALGMAAATFVVRVDEFKGSLDPLHVWIRNFHLATGAALLATCFLMTLRAANAAPRK